MDHKFVYTRVSFIRFFSASLSKSGTHHLFEAKTAHYYWIPSTLYQSILNAPMHYQG